MTFEILLTAVCLLMFIAAVLLWADARNAQRWEQPGPTLDGDPDAEQLHVRWERPVVYDDGSER